MTSSAKLTILIIGIVAIVLLVVYLVIGIIFFVEALKHSSRPNFNVPWKDGLFERNASNENLQLSYKWYDNTPHENINIKSREGKTLHAVQFKQEEETDNWAICLHGWTNVVREISSYSGKFYERGFNVILPVLRGHEQSESKYLTMGWLDRLDIVDWVNDIVQKNPNAKIIIMGVSMGGSAAMMATGEKLPKNVVLAIDDCGYTSVYDILEDQARRKYHLPSKQIMPSVCFVHKILNKFSLKEASCIDQLKKSETPTLFVHGDADDFVLPDALEKLYNACSAPNKEMHYIPNGTHALLSLCFHDEYWKIVDAYLAKFFSDLKLQIK